MKTLALITARAGSKRVPFKNLMMLKEKPLYQWTTSLPLLQTVDAVALSGDKLDQYVTPLKCIEIERPKELCEDNTPHHPVILHGLVEAEKRTQTEYDYLMLLQPTNPGRTMEEVERAVQMCEDKSPDFLYCYYVDENLSMSYLGGSPMDDGIREPWKVDGVVVRSGCVYMYKRHWIINGFPETNSMVAMRVSKARGYNLNVEEDFRIMEALMV